MAYIKGASGTLLDPVLKTFGLIPKNGHDLQVRVAMRKQWKLNDITGTLSLSVPGLDRV